MRALIVRAGLGHEGHLLPKAPPFHARTQAVTARHTQRDTRYLWS